jgi:hypothetical protein
MQKGWRAVACGPGHMLRRAELIRSFYISSRSLGAGSSALGAVAEL